MATFDQFRPVYAARPGLLQRLGARIDGWADRRATARALGKLTTRELDDLGLTRADIDAIAAGRRPATRVY
ncbi:DUF1127 domain-containing protein [Jannaschia sp. W003]|uniref:DUF1127 domain-containing protein n=1 Tax=Jannaschia sp. W003 TaxID=2867012 RepID=UPI0021A3AB46|nr:DUF1127 domain-containing protein [Jannaschia sp. W003]UWQ22537.1 DUF1127 domain-containing protein [Jannaschia sp. W003]